MIKDYNLYDERHSSVNWRKVLGNYRGSYNFNQEWEITILELIANSVDAKANIIDISTRIDKDGNCSIICQDNGLGMDKKVFEEYHNLGSLTKEKSGETIGFAGIGAKLCIDLCDNIYTETSTGKGKLASEWWFEKKDIEPKYKFIKPKDLLQNETGTYVEIRNLSNPPSNINNIKELVLDNYEYALRPYGNLKITINQKEINTIAPSKKYKSYTFKRTIKSKKLEKNIILEGKFFFVDDEFIQEIEKNTKKFNSGISIVVLGKTVLRNEYFGLITEMKPGHTGYLTGYISSNELIGITKTSKDDLNKKSNMWYYLVKESKDILKNWLNEIGELSERKDGAEKYSKLINSIEEDFNKIINNYPELLNNIPFLSNLKKPTPLSHPNGNLSGVQTDLGQFSKGTFGGHGNNPEDKVPTMGNEEGLGINLDPKGNVKVDTPKKKVKGPRIVILEEENRKDSVWFDAGLPGFIINGAHPAYFFYQENNNALHAYITLILFNCILDMQENMEESKRKEYIWNLYGTYLEQVR